MVIGKQACEAQTPERAATGAERISREGKCFSGMERSDMVIGKQACEARTAERAATGAERISREGKRFSGMERSDIKK
jgi:hypothetical protein